MNVFLYKSFQMHSDVIVVLHSQHPFRFFEFIHSLHNYFATLISNVAQIMTTRHKIRDILLKDLNDTQIVKTNFNVH